MRFLFRLIKKIVDKVGWQEITLFTLLILVLVPSLFISWMIIDDGVSILLAKKISVFLTQFDFRGLMDLFIEKESGRFRPGYWIFYWLSYLVVGNNPLGHHLIHILIVGGTTYLLFLIVKLFTSSKTVALIFSSLFLLAPLNIENWYRLGPQEPLITFYLGLSIYFSLKLGIAERRFQRTKLYSVLATIPLIFAYFTKETFVVFLPFAVCLFFGGLFKKDKRERKEWFKNYSYYLIINIILAVSSLLASLLIKTQGYYSQYYSLSPLDFISTAKSYLLNIWLPFGTVIVITILSFIIYIINFFKKQKFGLREYIQCIFLIGFISFLIIQIPWTLVMERYLQPVIFFMLIFLSFEVERILNFTKKFSQISICLNVLDKTIKTNITIKTLVKVVTVILYTIFIYGSIAPFYNYLSGTILGTRNIERLLRSVANETNDENTVYMNLKKGDATVELVFETGLHLNLFYNRPKIKVDYLDQNSINNLKNGDLIVTAIASSPFFNYRENQIRSNTSVKIIKTIDQTDTKLSLPSLPIESLIRMFLFKKNLDIDQFFSIRSNTTQWKIYKVS